MRKQPDCDELTRYRRGEMRPEERRAMEAHIGACAGCRDVLREAARSAAAALLRELPPTPGDMACPSRRQLQRCAEGTADAVDQEIVEMHIEDCPRCAADLESLRAPGRRLRPHPSRILLRPLGAALLLALIVAPGLWRTVQAGGSEMLTIPQRRSLMSQLAGQISDKTGEVLEEALPTLELARQLFKENPKRYGVLQAPGAEEHRLSRARLLLGLLKTTPSFNRIYFGDRWGTHTAAQREPDRSLRIECRTAKPPAQWLYPVRSSGGEQEIIAWNEGTGRRDREFDPRRRPWYKRAVSDGKFVWSLYRFFENDSYGITASLPVTGPGGKLAGVLGIDLDLDDLCSYVKRLNVLSPGARAFILSDRGEVVAQIPLDVTARVDAKPTPARESSDPMLKQAAAHLAGWNPGARDAALEFQAAGSYVAARRFAVKGLPWTVLVAVPEQDMRPGVLFLALPGAGMAALLLALGVRAASRQRPRR